MKLITTQLIFAAVAAFGVCGAQAQTMHAEVPFRFTLNGNAMPAGEYRVSFDRSPRYIEFENLDARKKAISFFSPQDVPRGDAGAHSPTLQFECAEGGCVLLQLWRGDGSHAAAFPAVKAKGRRLQTEGGTMEIIRLY